MKSFKNANRIERCLCPKITINAIGYLLLFVASLLGSFAYSQEPTVQLVERELPTSINFGHPNSDYVMTMSNGYHWLWDWKQKKVVSPRWQVYRKGQLAETDWGIQIAPAKTKFSRDGHFWAGCRNWKDTDRPRESLLLQVWDIRTGATAAELPRATPTESCLGMDFSPDGKTLAVAVSGFLENDAVLFFDTTSWKEVRRFTLETGYRSGGNISYSPNGEQLVIWAGDSRPPPGMDDKAYRKYQDSIDSGFRESKLEAIILRANNSEVLARKVLHWHVGESRGVELSNGFDASGERVISSFPYRNRLPEDTYKKCPAYQPYSVPEGFQPTDLCHQVKAIQVWHWRTGKVDTVYERPVYWGSRDYIPKDQPKTFNYMEDVQFTADGRFIVMIKKHNTATTPSEHEPENDLNAIEIRDANTYKVLLTQSSAKIGIENDAISYIKLSPNGRYLGFNMNRGHRRDFVSPRYLYEIVSN